MGNDVLTMAKRFRGFLPVIIDVETGGLDHTTDALLEIAMVFVTMNEEGFLEVGETYHEHVEPFEGARLDPESLALNGIDPDHPFRFAVDEKIALENLFVPVKEHLARMGCSRAVLVGHNAWFDLFFMKSAIARAGINKHPFHGFTTFDTATMGAMVFGETVLARIADAAGLRFDRNKAHSAIYDAEMTARLFCIMINACRGITP